MLQQVQILGVAIGYILARAQLSLLLNHKTRAGNDGKGENGSFIPIIPLARPLTRETTASESRRYVGCVL